MIEIIPNWHPILVHFTIGLLAISTALYAAGFALKKVSLLITARWNLWLGALITIGTVAAGLYAYNTVAHDGMSPSGDDRSPQVGIAYGCGVFVTGRMGAGETTRG